MNLQENIQRIKQMMGVIKENITDFTSILKFGSVGDEVLELQKVLGIFEDGKFGKQTEECVKLFQRIEPRIKDNGIVEQLTINKIKKFQDKEISWDSPKFCKSKSGMSNIITTQPITPKSSEDDGSSTNNEADVILMGGLDYRKGDKDINQQVNSLKTTVGNKKIIGFRYNDPSGVKNAIEKYPNAIVVLFSAGCQYSSKLASIVGDKNKLYIVEPYASSSGTKESVINAVSQGVPSENVVTGPSSSRGDGVVGGSTKTPNGVGHWGALEYVGNLFS
jgi:hypothetical protein